MKTIISESGKLIGPFESPAQISAYYESHAFERHTVVEGSPVGMHVRGAARWAERLEILDRTERHTGEFQELAVCVDDQHQVLCAGFGNAAYDHHRANRHTTRVYTLAGVLIDMDAEEGERNCVPGPRECD